MNYKRKNRNARRNDKKNLLWINWFIDVRMFYSKLSKKEKRKNYYVSRYKQKHRRKWQNGKNYLRCLKKLKKLYRNKEVI